MAVGKRKPVHVVWLVPELDDPTPIAFPDTVRDAMSSAKYLSTIHSDDCLAVTWQPTTRSLEVHGRYRNGQQVPSGEEFLTPEVFEVDMTPPAEALREMFDLDDV